MTGAEVEPMLKKGKGKASMTSTCLDLKPSYLVDLAAKPYTLRYRVPKLQKFDGSKCNTREHTVHLLDSMDPFAHNNDLCLRKFSKSLTDKAYTWFVNLKQGPVNDWEQ